MSQNKILILFLTVTTFAFSQQKKVDTVFVYEEVIIHDTIFIDRPLTKIDKAVFTSEDNKKDKLELTQNGKTIEIPIDTLIVISNKKSIEKEKKQSWFFGGRLHLGMASNSLLKEMDAPNTGGLGLGIWIRKALFSSDFSVGIGIDGFYWMSPFSFNALQNDSALNGYYFTDTNEPKLFQSIENKHFQLSVPVQIYYKIDRFTPSVGWFVSGSSYKAQFMGSSGSLPLQFDQMQSFKAGVFQTGYLAELQYAFSEHVSVGVRFSSGRFKNVVFNNKDDNQSFKIKNSFTENSYLLQLVYSL